MARKHLDQQLPDFRFDVSWPDTPTGGGIPLLDASVGKLSISIQDALITSYKSDKGDIGDALTIPLYNVAEWIAVNWWALLFEPRKCDIDPDEDIGFRSRHWLGYARDGFALPDLWFYPLGAEIEVSAYESYLRFARLEFLTAATASVPTDVVRDALASFMDDVLRKMSANGVSDTSAHEAWERVRSTEPDAEQYCRLIGALGLSPYEQHEEIDRIIGTMLMASTPASIVEDLFQVSDDSNLDLLAREAQRLWDKLPKVREVNIEPLVDIELPEPRGSVPWQWGKEAARKVRTNFGIASRDPKGGHAFFDTIGIDPSSSDVSDLVPFEAAVERLSGGVKRNDATMQIAIGEPESPRRRFAAARAAFLGWSSGASCSHLITTARTREQQASRAFAAELLAPIDYIRRRAGGSAVSMYRVEDIARELDVTPAVVKWQAQNNKLHVVESAGW
jgi:hypothetical protein